MPQREQLLSLDGLKAPKRPHEEGLINRLIDEWYESNTSTKVVLGAAAVAGFIAARRFGWFRPFGGNASHVAENEFGHLFRAEPWKHIPTNKPLFGPMPSPFSAKPEQHAAGMITNKWTWRAKPLTKEMINTIKSLDK